MYMLGFIVVLFVLSLLCPLILPNSKVSSSPYDVD